MLKKTAFHTGSAALILMLGACSWLQQPAAPVTAGTSGSVSSQTGKNNPYGATPYEPNAAGTSAATPEPYTPPPASSAPVSSGGGAYIPSNAPVDINAATHTVVRGDTVYNIAKRYNITQDNVREWNNLADNTISVGQTLRVKPAGYVAPAGTASASTPAPAPASKPAPVATPAKPAPAAEPVKTPTVSTGSTRTVSGITWQRPTAGNIITQFGGSSKGVDIAGTAGQAVVSAADGKVVYAGSGLRGYGNLVIIQHNTTFLTAYGHNQNLLVKEGQTVKRGQTIARMGNTDADRVKLHFEVRQSGKPVNPTQFVAF
ncbi:MULTISPECIES: peptidoglycan DD-metalloendopeptidase family protein [unclassified Neisseria]|uniref:peptidoglycan DD-metalloendopeptidase family protein n=1 Tax=unclassified Neisseria TaxID=2623750 RepID=UPI0026657B42|nr:MULTISPECIES: peptidoglycan DD-metalloendopeptidase family protein [unclassified Neisseria]MDO1510568.1 peptidoglycan DD-metalloendopeptidase family protein [Neisseria sp. MVDL19-042950]MDO1516361.1 peptidoglycan DD-metalloendopeptidase family protein [Neisseria sp. MVDL18-041461]MDO1564093.1 peptidoglycan DD-metalloendopeptidase family protein [Neisseria sp. MVDL20-010259]